MHWIKMSQTPSPGTEIGCDPYYNSCRDGRSEPEEIGKHSSGAWKPKEAHHLPSQEGVRPCRRRFPGARGWDVESKGQSWKCVAPGTKQRLAHAEPPGTQERPKHHQEVWLGIRLWGPQEGSRLTCLPGSGPTSRKRQHSRSAHHARWRATGRRFTRQDSGRA